MKLIFLGEAFITSVILYRAIEPVHLLMRKHSEILAFSLADAMCLHVGTGSTCITDSTECWSGG